MTGLLSWLACGLVAGLAGQLLPGPKSRTVPLIAGLAGALVGGLVATLLGMGGYAEADPRGMVLAFLTGALAVILTQLARLMRADR